MLYVTDPKRFESLKENLQWGEIWLYIFIMCDKGLSFKVAQNGKLKCYSSIKVEIIRKKKRNLNFIVEIYV